MNPSDDHTSRRSHPKTHFQGFCISSTITISVHKLNYENPTRNLTIQIGIAIFTSAALTLVTTLLIAYRVYSLSRRSVLTSTRKKKPYKDIVEILIQSSAIYSTVSLVYGISWVITLSSTTSLGREISEDYFRQCMQIFFFITAVSTPLNPCHYVNIDNLPGYRPHNHGRQNHPPICTRSSGPIHGTRVHTPLPRVQHKYSRITDRSVAHIHPSTVHVRHPSPKATL